MITLHVTSGDSSGELIKAADFKGEILVWRDILYEGKRNPGWPDDATITARAEMLSANTGGGLSVEEIKQGLVNQYEKLADAKKYETVLLWFDACLFDQSMLAHILSCLHCLNADNVELICVDSFPGIVPFDGLGQLKPVDVREIYTWRKKVSKAQFELAVKIDAAFAAQKVELFQGLLSAPHPEYPWINAAIQRWLEEMPDTATGLGKLETLALEAVNAGSESAVAIFKYVSSHDSHPQYWGDTTLWAKLNSLADKKLIKIDGPEPRLPQWSSKYQLERFRIQKL